ncbi:Glutamyl-tRNA reductase [bacterium HR23]|nr:Glutamyl-tRNA reductase [bacterium HR23]
MAPAASSRLVLLGTSFKTAPLALREQVAVPPDGLPDALQTLKAYLPRAVLVSTCNRTEIYFSPCEGHGLREAYRFLHSHFGITRTQVKRFFYRRQGWEAVRHLFRVVCGLDSQAVGEAEIMGQVRHAFQTAVSLGMAGPPLDRVFHSAFQTARQARQRASLPPVSLAHWAVDTALSAVSANGPVDALVVGAGEVGTQVALALRRKGVGRIWVANRTFSRAQALAELVDGEAVPLGRLAILLAQADLLIVSVRSGRPLLSPGDLFSALKQRSKPLCIVDMALPRSVHPAVGLLHGVRLFTLDDLKPASGNGACVPPEVLHQMEQAVEEGLARFATVWRSLSALPAISTLHRWAEGVRQEETHRLLRSLRHLDAEGYAHVEAFGKALVGRLLTPVVEHMKARPSPARLRRVLALFGLDCPSRSADPQGVTPSTLALHMRPPEGGEV